eukprot:CAMPEP_0118884124 /NCGR_PEP_ID=MMETSP1163-20130328/23052_1 /TAXON_ID=124430 /ORGANISM="Phaeomonas parva, Strain CCMP2877" /LENGTH=75 /DNA_ID=CAMNT_0006821797 /DNA_START=29 /DNA_END=253 /DNA_ORIENTATION=-
MPPRLAKAPSWVVQPCGEGGRALGLRCEDKGPATARCEQDKGGGGGARAYLEDHAGGAEHGEAAVADLLKSKLAV